MGMFLFLDYGLSPATKLPLAPGSELTFHLDSWAVLAVTTLYTIFFLLVGRWLWFKHQLKALGAF